MRVSKLLRKYVRCSAYLFLGSIFVVLLAHHYAAEDSDYYQVGECSTVDGSSYD